MPPFQGQLTSRKAVAVNIHAASVAGFVLRELTWRVRVLTVEQIARILAARHRGSVSVRSLIQRLQAERLISTDYVAAAFHEAIEPIASRQSDDAAPDFGALAWRLERRWREAISRRVTICWATSRAAGLFGGITVFTRRASQLEHDLGTASILVRLHETRPEFADQWVGEDILRRDFAPYCRSLQKIPDGAIVLDDAIVRVIEYGGQYSASRLRRFDSHFCKKHGIPYDIW
jgi:hypothetical protein